MGKTGRERAKETGKGMSERRHPVGKLFSRSRLRGETAVYLYSLRSDVRPLRLAGNARFKRDPFSSPEFLSSRVSLHGIKPTHFASRLFSLRLCSSLLSRVQRCFSAPVGFCSNRHIFRKLFRKNGDRGASRGESPGKKVGEETGDREKRERDVHLQRRVPRSVGLFVLLVRKTATTIQEGRKEERKRMRGRILGGVVNFSTKLPFSSFFAPCSPLSRLPCPSNE